METPKTEGTDPGRRRQWLRFAVAVVIMAALVTIFEVVPRHGSPGGMDSGRIARAALIALAAAAFITFGGRRR